MLTSHKIRGRDQRSLVGQHRAISRRHMRLPTYHATFYGVHHLQTAAQLHVLHPNETPTVIQALGSTFGPIFAQSEEFPALGRRSTQIKWHFYVSKHGERARKRRV